MPDRPHDSTAAVCQLTLDDWAKMLDAASEARVQVDGEPEAVTMLAEALAPRLAQQLSHAVAPLSEQAPTARLLTLDQLVAELPPAKRPQTWKRWLYERTRRGEIPGCVKLGGMLFFEREPALEWLRAGATTAR
ncbi:MAG: hypothetical protein HOQ03_12755 [Thermoleophilia bacterium]|nr:hypothetical protein [Thermoleophilia bacterium]